MTSYEVHSLEDCTFYHWKDQVIQKRPNLRDRYKYHKVDYYDTIASYFETYTQPWRDNRLIERVFPPLKPNGLADFVKEVAENKILSELEKAKPYPVSSYFLSNYIFN